MENNIPSPDSQLIEPQQSQVSNAVKVFRFLVIFALISPLVYTNYILRTRLEKYTSQSTVPAPSITLSPTPTITTVPVVVPADAPFVVSPTPAAANSELWRVAKYGEVFSYMYPTGWHVAELWPEASGGPIRIAMDPKPITTAPMGGPSSTFNINFFNGLPKPDDKLSELKSQLKPEYFTEIKTETIDSVNGPIFYHSGKISGEYMNGTKVENYLFTVKRSSSDPQNVQVMQATLYGGDQKQSEMFRYVVLSFKSL